MQDITNRNMRKHGNFTVPTEVMCFREISKQYPVAAANGGGDPHPHGRSSAARIAVIVAICLGILIVLVGLAFVGYVCHKKQKCCWSRSKSRSMRRRTRNKHFNFSPSSLSRSSAAAGKPSAPLTITTASVAERPVPSQNTKPRQQHPQIPTIRTLKHTSPPPKAVGAIIFPKGAALFQQERPVSSSGAPSTQSSPDMATTSDTTDTDSLYHPHHHAMLKPIGGFDASAVEKRGKNKNLVVSSPVRLFEQQTVTRPMPPNVVHSQSYTPGRGSAGSYNVQAAAYAAAAVAQQVNGLPTPGVHVVSTLERRRLAGRNAGGVVPFDRADNAKMAVHKNNAVLVGGGTNAARLSMRSNVSTMSTNIVGEI